MANLCMHHYTRVEGGTLETLLSTYSRRGSRAPGRWWDCSGLDRRSEVIPRYANAPMIMFVPEETVVATKARFVKIVGFFLIILQAFKLFTQKTPTISETANMHKNAKHA